MIIVAAPAGGDWNTGSSWVGGVAPTAADDAQIPSTAGNMVIGTGAVCRSADFSTYTGQLSGTGTLTIGDATAGASNIALKLVSGMTISGTPAFSFVSTSATQQTIDFAGKTTGAVDHNGSTGNWLWTGGHTVGTSTTVTLTRGTLNLNGQTVSWGLFNSNNSNTRSLTLGAANITITGGNTNVWLVNTGTGLTTSMASSTITLTGSSAAFLGGFGTYGTVIMSGPNNATVGGGTFTTFTRTGTASKTDTLILSGNNTTTGTFTVTGNSGANRVFIQSSTGGTARQISAGTVSINNADITDITGAGAGSWNLSGGIVGDCGGTTNITFTSPTTQTWNGTSGGAFSTNAWSGRVPLPQDTASFAVAFSASQTVTMDMPRIGTIDWTGATGSPTANYTTNYATFGSITFISGMTVSGNVAHSFNGRGTFNITSAGKSFVGTVTINARTSTYVLQDDGSTSGTNTTTHSLGGFNLNNHTWTTGIFNGNNQNARTLTFGTGTIAVTSTAAQPWLYDPTNCTISAASGTVRFSGATSNARRFSMVNGGMTLGTLDYTVTGSTGSLQIEQANIFTTINFYDPSNARTLIFPSSTTTRVTTFNVNGTSGKLMSIISSTSSTAATIRFDGIPQSCVYLSVKDITATIQTLYAGSTSTNVSGNTNVVFQNIFFPTLTDSLTLTPLLIIATGKKLSDSQALSETFSRLAALYKSFTDSISLTSTMTKIYNNTFALFDSITLTETSFRAKANKVLSESVTLVETLFTAKLTKIFSNTITLVSTFSKYITKRFVDSSVFAYLLIQDGFNLLQEDGSKISLDGASGSFPEVFTKKTGKNFATEVITLVEYFIKVFVRKYPRSKLLLRIKRKLTVLR